MATITSLLSHHVAFELRSIDRIFLQAYSPALQSMGQVIKFLLHKGFPIPSGVALGKIGRAIVASIETFVSENDIPLVRFHKKEVKEDVVAPYLERARAEGRTGVVMVGIAQEKASAWRAWKTGGRPEHPHFELGRQSVFVNHYYFYVFDDDFGPCFFKLCPYAPYPVWVWCNGHEWAKRQADKQGLAYEAMDNGFGACAAPERLQALCDRLSASHIRTLVERWLRVIPGPFTDADRAAGFWWDVAFRQLELSDTRVFDQPRSVRGWFEATIRDHLDLGRPDRVSLVFSRKVQRNTRGRFCTRVITRGVDPLIQIHYKSSKIKQYLKGSRALRTETTINNARDFDIGTRVRQPNFEALKSIGFGANARLIDLEVSSEACAPDADTLTEVVLPSTNDGLPAPALRFGDPRVVALLGALAGAARLNGDITNASLRLRVAGLLDRPYSSRHMTYDLRRLRRKGFIERIEGTHAYRLTVRGRRLSMFFTKLYTRVVTPSLAHLQPDLPAAIASRTPIGRAGRAFDRAIDDLIASSAIVAA